MGKGRQGTRGWGLPGVSRRSQGRCSGGSSRDSSRGRGSGSSRRERAAAAAATAAAAAGLVAMAASSSGDRAGVPVDVEDGVLGGAAEGKPE